MKTALLSAAMLVLIAATFAVPAVPATAAPTTTEAPREHIRLRGVIAQVNRHSIVLVLRSGREVEIGVVDRTRISLNGERAHLGDLQPRDRAKVIAVHTRRGLIARAIRARRGDGG